MYPKLSNLFSWRDRFRSNQGVSLIEALIGVALISGIGLATAFVFTQGRRSQGFVGNFSNCQGYANGTIAAISSIGTGDLILPPFTDPTLNGTVEYQGPNYAPTKILPPQAANIYSKFGIPWFSSTGADSNSIAAYQPASTCTSGVATLTNSQLIVDSTNYLQKLYNNQPQICRTPGLDIKSALYPNAPPELRHVYLSVIPYDLSANAKSACTTTPLFSAPRRQVPKPLTGFNKSSNNCASDNFAIMGNSDLGFLAAVQVEYVPTATPKGTSTPVASERTTICSANHVFSHQRDDQLPADPTIETTNGATGCTASSCVPGPCTCTPTSNFPSTPSGHYVLNAGNTFKSLTSFGAGYNTLNVTVSTDTVKNIERGTVFLCQNLAPHPDSPRPCNIARLCTNPTCTTSIPATYSASVTDPSFTLSFPSVPNGNYNLAIIAVDPSGNRSFNAVRLDAGTGTGISIGTTTTTTTLPSTTVPTTTLPLTSSTTTTTFPPSTSTTITLTTTSTVTTTLGPIPPTCTSICAAQNICGFTRNQPCVSGYCSTPSGTSTCGGPPAGPNTGAPVGVCLPTQTLCCCN